MLKWLFFDLGSTIIDESACDEFRLRELLKQPGAPDRGALEEVMAKLARENLHPYRDAAERFGLQKSPWPGHLERLYPEAAPVLEKLHRNYKLGIIANQNPGTESRLDEYGIRKYFDVIAASAECGVAKPTPELFQIVLAWADCDPWEAVMIGDRLDNDIVPAERLGMKTVWIRQGMFRIGDPKLMGVKPSFTVDSLEELLNIL